MKLPLLTLLFILVFQNVLLSQIGIHGAKTISVANTIVNEYTTLTADAASGNSSITVASNNLNANSRFSGALTQGDLIMIIQMQGVTMNITPSGIFSLPNNNTWGAVSNYNNCGNYEFAQVVSVAGSTTINILCGLKNNYTATGHVQVIRVPRYTTLTVNSSLTSSAWNGSTGGIVAVEVQGATTIGGSGSITVNTLGFRGGAVNDNVAVYGGGAWGSSNNDEGAEKGEGVGGYTTEYTALVAMYCKGAPANGGGGGNGHNNGGGGGGNAGNLGTYTGTGVPNPAYNTIWNLETPAIGGTSSSGGGRGGNSFSQTNLNAAVVPPADPTWNGDYNRTNGGMGGRPLDYSTGKIFMGGGGGAGDQNDGDAGTGGSGGGMVFIISYNNVSGTGVISANGNIGTSSLNSGYPFSGYAGKDGAGGGGAGGTVIINANGTVSGITINANGGKGGDQFFPATGTGNDAYGPGGGGSGGYIAVSNGTPTRTATGGVNGTTNSTGFTEFPPKGATSGGTGLPNEVFPNYYFTVNNVTVCYNTSATLTATIVGTVPGGVALNWYASQFSTTSLGSGTSFTTPALTTTTTYYVGFCPGYYRLPVTVTVSPAITINTASLSITNATCGMSNGSISGITVSGGTGSLTYQWNGVPSGTPNLSGALAGSYTLTVTDAALCTATAGPFTINNTGGPTINTASMVITNTTCGLSNGSITGITASGGTGTLTYDWNGTSYPSADLNAVNSGSYTLTVTDGAGCSSSAGPYTISNVPGPTINTTAMVITNATCGLSNGSITGITATGGTGTLTYDWNGTSYPSTAISTIGVGSYTLTVTDAAGCSSSAGPFSITNNGGVTINVTGIIITDANCGLANGSITGITASSSAGGLTYTWNAISTPTADLTAVSGGSYTLTVNDGVGCSASVGPYLISNIGAPIIDTSAMVITNTSCGLNNGSIAGIIVSGTGTLTFQWNGTPAANQNLSNVASGSFILTVTDGSGCSQTAGPFTINPSTDVTLSGTVTNVSCFSLNDGSITANATGGGGTISYNWLGGPSAPTNGSLTAGTYTVIATSTDGCDDTLSFTVTEPPSINPSITGISSICNGQSVTLTANGGGTYSWNTGASTDSIVVSPTSNTTYDVDVTVGGCTETATFPVTVNSLPTASITGATTICQGMSTTLNASGGSSYLWSDGSSGSSMTVSPSATTGYYVIASNACGDDTTFITVNVNGTFTVDAGPDQTIPIGSSTTINASSATTYSWTPSGTLSCSDCQNPIASPTSTTTYILTATNGSGCSGYDTITIIVDETISLFVPDIFAPNGNVANDVLYVRGTGISSMLFRVYDRWGQKVFESTDINYGWDGNFRNKPLDTGVFVYTLEGMFANGEEFNLKGNVTLKR